MFYYNYKFMQKKINLKKGAIILLFISALVFIIFLIIILKCERYKYIYGECYEVYSQIFKRGSVTNNIGKYMAMSAKKKEIKEFYFKNTLKRNAEKTVSIPTYEKSGQAMHPDIVYDENGVLGHKYWMAFTPYPFYEDKYEDPSIVVSEDGKNFSLPSGAKNPVLDDIGDKDKGGHLSDTDLMYNKNQLILHYVYNKKGVLGPSKFYRIVSDNGINWSKPNVVYLCKETGEGYSPAFIIENDITKMWYFAGEDNLIFTESKDDEKSWSKIKKCKLNMSPWKGWHFDVIKTDKEYEALICARLPRIQTRALFYAKSTDCINWYVSKYPIIFPKENSWDGRDIYRSTMIKEKGKYKIWYSAVGRNRIWNTGYTEFEESEINNLQLQSSES